MGLSTPVAKYDESLALPYFMACVRETLRRDAPAQTILPRIISGRGLRLPGGEFILRVQRWVPALISSTATKVSLVNTRNNSNRTDGLRTRSSVWNGIAWRGAMGIGHALVSLTRRWRCRNYVWSYFDGLKSGVNDVKDTSMKNGRLACSGCKGWCLSVELGRKRRKTAHEKCSQ